MPLRLTAQNQEPTMLFSTSPLSFSYWTTTLPATEEIRIPDDDSSSISSTISVGGTLPKGGVSSDSPKTQSRRRRARVQFDETLNVSFADPRQYVTEQDLEESWLTAAEYQAIKLRYKASVRQLIARSHPMGQGGPPPPPPRCSPAEYHQHQSFLNILNRVYESCCDVDCERHTSVVVDDLWMPCLIRALHEASDELHGLEKVCSRILVEDKSFRRSEVMETVLSLQQEDETGAIDDFFVEMIRCAAENITRPARCLAQRLAHAQHEAIMLST